MDNHDDPREVTRIDFFKLPKGYRVSRLHESDGMGTQAIPVRAEVKGLDFDLSKALDWCRANGWVVREWPGGARAWKGDRPRPVRHHGRIQKLRDELRRYPRPELEGKAHTLDLAYDL